MIATLEIVQLLDQSEYLGKMILSSDVMDDFHKAKASLEEDEEAQRLIAAFQAMKEQYEDVQRFGRYHPDYSTIMKEIRSTKREMDMNEKVASFKIAERKLQELLDDVSELVAHSVSNNVKVPRDGAALKDGGCGCGSGSGGCGCRAS
ncbi:YlbF family regulator [Radiobacillus deserti]|uniref:YlbF family regulator n=1 Tax=Radiobacillus deserti TaxID=2594883 RepID=A0A516KFB1_9BACI|nr:YlbF family regulator [Radiobacillus deserti]QDP40070.1 YlbF family regulator [Radiobacillus deserti]